MGQRLEVAPITIGAGAIISNKVTICAGVTIGQNTRVGANAVVTASLPPNTTALGIPAQVTARHPGPLDLTQPRPKLRIGWFGTSLMEHLEAHNPRLHTQADLPEIGEHIEVTERRHRGYVTALTTHWQTHYPWVTITSDNHGEGGATSRDVLANLHTAIDRGDRWDLTVLGVGINDIWRHHQGRHSEAVDLAEYETNLVTMLELLTDRARQVLVIGEPPMGWEPGIDVPTTNTDLLTYNAAARRGRRRALHRPVGPDRPHRHLFRLGPEQPGRPRARGSECVERRGPPVRARRRTAAPNHRRLHH
ncbi:GDSL-type esterase/lipase family protein [Nocardia higoensis]|uniref:GDSL-type esterase/lipase family protein n=1 Tax=Nocardia higoensis TaxID=228599 RepID=UPI00030B747D|nr:GDSL-type esterase/lipase family protein [Nocardia higoensis]